MVKPTGIGWCVLECGGMPLEPAPYSPALFTSLFIFPITRSNKQTGELGLIYAHSSVEIQPHMPDGMVPHMPYLGDRSNFHLEAFTGVLVAVLVGPEAEILILPGHTPFCLRTREGPFGSIQPEDVDLQCGDHIAQSWDFSLEELKGCCVQWCGGRSRSRCLELERCVSSGDGWVDCGNLSSS